MAEYWHLEPACREKAQEFFVSYPEAEVELQFDIAEKDFVNSGKGSAEVKNVLKRLGVNADALRRVAVASYEAEINVTAHSYGGRMHSYIYDDFVYIRFEDTGPGIADIEQAMEPGFSTADELVREMGFGAGLGLANIKKNSDVMHLVSAAGEPTVLEILLYY